MTAVVIAGVVDAVITLSTTVYKPLHPNKLGIPVHEKIDCSRTSPQQPPQGQWKVDIVERCSILGGGGGG